MKRCIEAFAAPGNGAPVVYPAGAEALDDDPIVKKYPQFFEDAEESLKREARAKGRTVEEATTEPGRGRGKLSRPRRSKGVAADDPKAPVPEGLKLAPADHQAAFVAKAKAGGKPESKGATADDPDAKVPAGLDEAPAADQAAFVDEGENHGSGGDVEGKSADEAKAKPARKPRAPRAQKAARQPAAKRAPKSKS